MTFTDPYRTIIVDPVEIPSPARPREEPARPDLEPAREREPEPTPAVPPDHPEREPEPVPAGARALGSRASR